MHWTLLWSLLYSSFLAWKIQSSIQHLLLLSCHWTLSWFLWQNLPNPEFWVLCLTYWAFSVHICLLHLFWGEPRLLWSCCQSPWPCYFWGTIVFPSTSLWISFRHHQTILGPVLCSLVFLPVHSHCLLLVLVLVLLTFLCLFFHSCLRLLLWSAKILVVLTMPQYHSFFWNLSWFLFVVTTTCVSSDRYSA